MLFTEPHIAKLRQVTKDSYGTISAVTDVPFHCYAERRTKYGYNAGQQIELGKGVLYTTIDTLAFTVGSKVLVNNEEFVIKRAERYEGIEGCFTHWELMYA
jgi:hypothetical protein